MADEVKEAGQVGSEAEIAAVQRAKERASTTRWQLNVAVVLFGILIIIMVLLSQGMGIDVVGLVAILGLVMVWVMGWKRERHLYRRFYREELSHIVAEPEKEASALLSPLTPRELETLNYVAQGYANKEIALELGISEDTIKTHVARILTKMNASDRTEAAVVALKKGFISAE